MYYMKEMYSLRATRLTYLLTFYSLTLTTLTYLLLTVFIYLLPVFVTFTYLLTPYILFYMYEYSLLVTN